jgi:formyl-CoA transferase
MTEKLLRSIGQEALITDPRFANNPARVKNWQELDAIIGAFIGARDLAENLAHFDKAGVTIGPIMDTEMLDKDPYAIEREALIEVPDADMPGGWLPMHGMVPRLSATPGILARPAPKLGEHNSEILRAALGAARYESLCAAKVIRD